MIHVNDQTSKGEVEQAFHEGLYDAHVQHRRIIKSSPPLDVPPPSRNLKGSNCAGAS